MGVVNIRPLELGMLSGQDERHPEGIRERASRGDRGADFGRDNLRRSQAMEFLTEDGSQNLAQVALRYVLSTPGVSTVLAGFTNARQVEEAAAASDMGPLAGEDLARIATLYRSDFGLAPGFGP